MKKYFLVVLCALSMLVVTGCGKEKVVCKGSFNEDGLSADAEMEAEFTDNKISDVTVTYILKDDETAKTWCALFKLMEDSDKGTTVKCSGSKITIKGLDKLEADDEDNNIAEMTKEAFVEYAEKENLTCK